MSGGSLKGLCFLRNHYVVIILIFMLMLTDSHWQDGPIMSSLARKGEALAVSGLVEYGDEIDVIAPTDILKQIFKIPYSKARVSVAVHRVGQTLVLNSG